MNHKNPNPAYFCHEKVFKKCSIRGTHTFTYYMQDRIAFDILMRVKDFSKLNNKLKKKVVGWIKSNVSINDDIVRDHYNKEYNIPLDIML